VSAEVTDADDGVVEFEFGSPQVAPGAAFYELVTRDGVSLMATDINDSDGGDGDDGVDFQTFLPGTVETRPDADEPSTTVRVTFECLGDESPDQYDNADRDGDNDDDPCQDADAGDGADLSGLTLRRANVISATGRIHTADLGSSGNTNGPDLADIVFASEEDELEDNQALFVFDEALDSGGDTASAFVLAYSHCGPGTNDSINGLIGDANLATEDDFDTQDGEGYDDAVDIAGGCQLTGQDIDFDPDANLATDADTDEFGDEAVLVTFDADAVVENDFLVAAQVTGSSPLSAALAFVGTDIDADASEAGGDNISNNNDELELNVQPASLYDDGEVGGPQITEASVEIDTSFGGDFAAYMLTLTFDKDIDEDAALAAGSIDFWYEDAEQVESDEITIGDCEVDDDTTIVCEISGDDPEDLTFTDAAVVSVDAGAVNTADTFTLGDGNEEVVFDNPEQSIEVEIPEFDGTTDDE